MSNLRKLLKERILILDGATGTELQKLKSADKNFKEDKYSQCSEYLNLSRPDIIQALYESYLKAGADIIETSTFNATDLSLKDYGLEDKVKEINIASVKIAKEAIKKYSKDKPRFIAGCLGPTPKSIFVLGKISFDEMKASYYEQAVSLIEGGADILSFDTTQDIMNLKAGLEASFEAKQKLNSNIEIMAFASFGMEGIMLSGQDVETFYNSLAHYDLLALGLNCATGPDEMKDKLKKLSSISKFPVCIMPNAGLPDENGNYLLAPKIFAEKTFEFAKNGWVNLLGGCCGTTPGHIAELTKKINGAKPRTFRKKLLTL